MAITFSVSERMRRKEEAGDITAGHTPDLDQDEGTFSSV